MYRCRECL